MANPLKILFVTSEAHPLIKTGGLGDVSGSLPPALKAQRHDVRVILPAYRAAMRKASNLGFAAFDIEGAPATVRLLQGKIPGKSIKFWLVDSPNHFDRPGGPYVDPDGHDWSDNAERYATFARTVTAVARNKAGLNWQPDIVHCNDWQSGLVPALLAQYPKRPATVFTIHNLAYHGHFDQGMFTRLRLPDTLWGMDGLEFHGGLSFIKGGLVYADMINTVSPTYAEEIRTPEFGWGLEGLLSHRANRLRGILNGVDYKLWSPAGDPYIPQQYDDRNLQHKLASKRALQQEFNLPPNPDIPLLGLVGRLVAQKGIDLVLDIIERVAQHNAQLVLVGTGDKRFEQAILDAAKHKPGHIGAWIGFSERLAHLIEAGADMFLMPSRFEPCGLNQIYSLRYGTVPIVRRTGGLADTVVDATADAINAGLATGFTFGDAKAEALAGAVDRAIELYRKRPKVWKKVVLTGMKQDFSWKRSAKHYLELYYDALSHRGTTAEA